MSTYLPHSPVAAVVGSVRSHALLWLVVTALVLAAATAALIVAINSGSSAQSAPVGPSISPASVQGDYVYPPPYHSPSGKYLP